MSDICFPPTSAGARGRFAPANAVAAKAPAASSRIAALDMLRGLALIQIMLNHMPVSPASGWTIRHFFLFDAAELFVLLSGLLVGMVWSGVQQRQGLRAAQWRFAVRALQIWRAMMIAAVLMAALSAALTAAGMAHTAVWTGYGQMLMSRPLAYLAAVGGLWMQPNLLDVLALYVVLMAAVPLMLPLMLRWPLGALAVSATLWWLAVPLNALIPNERPDGNGLLFNPFGWQALFFAGAAMGLYRTQLMDGLRRHAAVATLAALIVLTFGAAVLIGWAVGAPLAPLRNALFRVHGVIDKWPLDAVRAVSVLAAAWLAAGPLARLLAWLAGTAPGRAMSVIGRGGLVSFVACVLLSVAGDAMQVAAGTGSWRLAIDAMVIAALWCAATLAASGTAPQPIRTAQGHTASAT